MPEGRLQNVDSHSKKQLKEKHFEDCEIKSNIETMEADPSEQSARSLSENSDTSSGRQIMRRRRHTKWQVQRLEALYKESPWPDRKAKKKLGQELGMHPIQVKFWFQNKRSKARLQEERDEKRRLKAQNEKLQEEALHTTCVNCISFAASNRMYLDNQRLEIENARLKEELEKLSAISLKYVAELMASNCLRVPPQLPFYPPEQPPIQSVSVEETYQGIDPTALVSIPPEDPTALVSIPPEDPTAPVSILPEEGDLLHHALSSFDDDEFSLMIKEFISEETLNP